MNWNWTNSLVIAGMLSVSSGFTLHAADPKPADEAQFITHTRQFIFEGKRSGEGYFSPDGQCVTLEATLEARK